MAIDNTALSNEPTAAENAPPQSEQARRSDRRIPVARETPTLQPESEGPPVDFELHDTIPAPPWLDELEEPAP